ncbi:hypothetical protein [Kitasatospora sp. NPDC058046]|uniref:hypothetical protein n=1 Tax=Kitasatospora sp. NPDC058046 TaxID=3346312 RepID=UPI0036DC2C59
MTAPIDPIDPTRLNEIRSLNLAVLLPNSDTWTATTRTAAQALIPQLGPILHELLDEIDELGLDVEDAEREVNQLSTQLKVAEETIASLRRRLRPETSGTISAINRERIGRDSNGRDRWRVRWREGGRRRSRVCYSRRAADGLMGDLLERQRGSW